VKRMGRPPLPEDEKADHITVQIDTRELLSRMQAAKPKGMMQKDFTSELIRLGLAASRPFKGL